MTASPPLVPLRKYDIPVPGSQTTVDRVPLLPGLSQAPLRPTDVDTPDLLTLSRTPGPIVIRREKRKPIATRYAGAPTAANAHSAHLDRSLCTGWILPRIRRISSALFMRNQSPIIVCGGVSAPRRAAPAAIERDRLEGEFVTIVARRDREMLDRMEDRAE